MIYLTDKDLLKLRGKVVNAVSLETANYCASRGDKHDFSATELATGVWLDSCEKCPQTTLVITAKARRFRRKVKP